MQAALNCKPHEVMEKNFVSRYLQSSKYDSHVYFASPPIPRSCAYLDSLGKFRFRA